MERNNNGIDLWVAILQFACLNGLKKDYPHFASCLMGKRLPTFRKLFNDIDNKLLKISFIDSTVYLFWYFISMSNALNWNFNIIQYISRTKDPNYLNGYKFRYTLSSTICKSDASVNEFKTHKYVSALQRASKVNPCVIAWK